MEGSGTLESFAALDRRGLRPFVFRVARRGLDCHAALRGVVQWSLPAAECPGEELIGQRRVR